MSKISEIKKMLEAYDEEQRAEIFQYLRQSRSIHPIEKELNAKAEIILEAISRASDLTLRGIRGIIAEAAFSYDVVSHLTGWEDITPAGDHPYDYLLRDSIGNVSIQVKMQRQKDHRPMRASEGYKILSSDMYVVETQRTRGGRDPKTGEDTRPYRFGEFDILAVSLHPSTNDWSLFRYTVANWLIPRVENTQQLLKFQPVAMELNDDWTDDLETCVGWFRSGTSKTISVK